MPSTKSILLALSAAALLAACSSTPIPKAAAKAQANPSPAISIQSLTGSASISKGGGSSWSPLAPTDTIPIEAQIRTGKNGDVVLRLPYTDSKLRVLPNSVVAFKKYEKMETFIDLITGRILVSIRSIPADTKFELIFLSGVIHVWTPSAAFELSALGDLRCLNGQLLVAYPTPNFECRALTAGPGEQFIPGADLRKCPPVTGENIPPAELSRLKSEFEKFR